MNTKDYCKGERLYGNITDKELGYLPDGIIECRGCGDETVDASDDGDGLCVECLQEREEARLENLNNDVR